MIDIRKLKELVRLMVANDLTELDLRDAEEQVLVRRGGAGQQPQVMVQPAHYASAPPPMTHPPQHVHSTPPAGGGTASAAVDVAEAEGLMKITSPMVGTFYLSPNPDSPAFVSVGASVQPNTTVCVIEAMKIFNEIKAEVAGTIERVLVKNAEAVEFGQALFLVRPA
jgi:acetyl-CoA carboxylase biotin carboxyl carrier protein